MLPESRRWEMEEIGEGQLSGTYPKGNPQLLTFNRPNSPISD
jgi:hypothetical protein